MRKSPFYLILNYDYFGDIMTSTQQRIICMRPHTKSKFSLSRAQIQLLQLTAMFGFLSAQQIDRLYQILTLNNKGFSSSTLARWSAPRKGILTSTTKAHHNMYTLANWAQQWLSNHSFLTAEMAGSRVRNIHNLLLNEAIINGLFMTYQDIRSSSKGSHDFFTGFGMIAYQHALSTPINSADTLLQQENALLTAPLEESLKVTEAIPAWLHGLDLRTFNCQVGRSFQDNLQTEFQPDALISRPQEHLRIYVEFDNRTENNYTLVDKFANYIEYAQTHPSEQVNLLMVFNDGSVRNAGLTEYRPPMTKITTLSRATIVQKMHDQQTPIFLAYEHTKNIRIFLSPLKDSWVDFRDLLIAQPLHSMCHTTITNWQKHFNQQLKLAIGTNHPTRRYQVYTYPAQFIQANTAQRGPVVRIILGQEHLLDTMITFKMAAQHNQQHPVLVVYPQRFQAVNAILDSKAVNPYLESLAEYMFTVPAFIQVNPNYSWHQPKVQVLSNQLSTECYAVPISTKQFS